MGLYLPLFLLLKNEFMVGRERRAQVSGQHGSPECGQPRRRALLAAGRSARPLSWWPLPGKVAPTFLAQAGLQRNPSEGGFPSRWGREVGWTLPRGQPGDSTGPVRARAHGAHGRARSPARHAPAARRAPWLKAMPGAALPLAPCAPPPLADTELVAQAGVAEMGCGECPAPWLVSYLRW